MITVHVRGVPGPNAWVWQVLLVGLHPSIPPVVAREVRTEVEANLIKVEIESNLRHPELSPEIYPPYPVPETTRFFRILAPEESAEQGQPDAKDDHDQERNRPGDEPEEEP